MSAAQDCLITIYNNATRTKLIPAHRRAVSTNLNQTWYLTSCSVQKLGWGFQGVDTKKKSDWCYITEVGRLGSSLEGGMNIPQNSMGRAMQRPKESAIS